MKSGSTVRVPLGDRSYPVCIGSRLMDAASSYAGLPKADACLVVTNTTVAPLYLEWLTNALADHFPHIHPVILPDGEQHKNWQTLQLIFDALLEHGCDRQTIIFALGGGVVGDMAGFAAACYMRGVPCVQIPTTLLSQVDSSVGGKTAINHPLGKNMIGAFSQPVRVVIDIDTLRTLATRERVAGLAEVIKYGAVADPDFLSWIETNLDSVLALEPSALIHMVTRSCQLKADVVEADERESGIRATLNFGHTFAHAIETGVGYGTWLHGEAVGCGMAMAAHLSARLGLVDDAASTRLRHLIERAGLPTNAPDLGADRYLELMRLDKKAVAGELRFVLLDGPGRASVHAVPTAAVVETLHAFVA